MEYPKVSCKDLKVGDIFATAQYPLSTYKVISIGESDLTYKRFFAKIIYRDTFLQLDKFTLILIKSSEQLNFRAGYKETKLDTCNHSSAYKNHAGGTLFWYCLKCKQDLGNV